MMGGLPMGDKITLNEEQRKMLEGLSSFNVNSTIWYTAKAHMALPEEIRPQFKVRPFRKNEIEKVRKILVNIKDADEGELREHARLCIVDMSNFYDAGTGELVEYKQAPDGGMDKDLYSTIPMLILSDILMYVSRISGLLSPETRGL